MADTEIKITVKETRYDDGRVAYSVFPIEHRFFATADALRIAATRLMDEAWRVEREGH